MNLPSSRPAGSSIAMLPMRAFPEAAIVVPAAAELIRMTVAQAISDADQTRSRAAIMLVGTRASADGAARATRFADPPIVPRSSEWRPLRWNDTTFALVGHGYVSWDDVFGRARELLAAEQSAVAEPESGGARARVWVVGIGLYPEDGAEADELIARAEEALQDGLTLGYAAAGFSTRRLCGCRQAATGAEGRSQSCACSSPQGEAVPDSATRLSGRVQE